MCLFFTADDVHVMVEELYFKGELLDEDFTLSDYGIKHRSRVKTCLKTKRIPSWRMKVGAAQKTWRSMEELADFKDVCSIQ